MSQPLRKHLVFIINPKSGTDRMKAMEAAITHGLDAQKFSFEIQHTRYAKHGIELAKTAAQHGAYAVVAVGGDGSVNDVAAGILGTSARLGILPKGSGNGLARTLGIPLTEAAAIAVLNKDKLCKIDIGLADDRLFLSNAGVGFDALISRAFATSRRRGLAIYSWLVTKHLWTYRESKWKITIDGKPLEERAFLVNVANGQQFGYNFKIAPNASLTDGLFDVVVIRRFPKVFGGTLLWRAMHGSLLRSPYVRHFRGKEVVISHPDLKLMQTDGDGHPCDQELRFVMKEKALNVLVP